VSAQEGRGGSEAAPFVTWPDKPVFHDHFSARATGYSAYRPAYPAALLRFIAGLPARRHLAWDCATGSGQAAIALADHFASVIATDPSEAQLAHARVLPGVEYRVETAEQCTLPDASVDLVSVAQAIHWFDLEPFYSQVHRVLAPGGVIAIWGYGTGSLAEPELDAVFQEYAKVTLREHWPVQRQILDDGYRTIPFPFAEIPAPSFDFSADWTLAELAGYLRTWSATARFAAVLGRDPVSDVESALAEHWGDPDRRRSFRWPLYLRVGRKRA
jgi:SAM-dependent methyltransferase